MSIPPGARIAFSVGIVLVIIWRVPVEGLCAAFQNIEAGWLWPALASAMATLFIRCLKWQRLLQCALSRSSPRDATRALFGGFALGIITPGRVGEFGRCLFIPEAKRASIFTLNILDRVLDSWAIGTYAVASLFVAGRWPLGILATATWLATLPLVLGLARRIASGSGGAWWSESFRAQLQSACVTLGSIRIAAFAAAALASTTFDVLTFFFLLRAFSPVNLSTAFATFPWIVIASAIPLSIGGLGLREGAAALLLSRHAIPAAVATDVALLLFAFLILAPALIGGAWLLAERVGTTMRLRSIAATQLGISLRKSLG